MQSSQGLQNAPERAFLPAQAMMPGQMHSNCSMASLVSGSAAAQEGSHSSSTIGIPAHSMGALAQQAPLQLGPDGASLAAMQGLQPYLQASGAQDLPTLASIHHHPSFQGKQGYHPEEMQLSVAQRRLCHWDLWACLVGGATPAKSRHASYYEVHSVPLLQVPWESAEMRWGYTCSSSPHHNSCPRQCPLR